MYFYNQKISSCQQIYGLIRNKLESDKQGLLNTGVKDLIKYGYTSVTIKEVEQGKDKKKWGKSWSDSFTSWEDLLRSENNLNGIECSDGQYRDRDHRIKEEKFERI